MDRNKRYEKIRAVVLLVIYNEMYPLDPNTPMDTEERYQNAVRLYQGQVSDPIIIMYDTLRNKVDATTSVIINIFESEKEDK